MRLLQLLTIAGLMGLALAPMAAGTPEYSEKEGKKDCVLCHTAFGKADLNATGKCYRDHKYSLADCLPKPKP